VPVRDKTGKMTEWVGALCCGDAFTGRIGSVRRSGSDRLAARG
jgi:hypothetical protein